MKNRLERRLLVALIASTVLAALPAEAAKNRLALRYQSVELPGPPSLILPADLDADGNQDLVVVVAYTEWDQIGIEESVEMDDIEGLVEVLTIVPSLTDRRELWVFLGTDDGGYRRLAEPLPLDPSLLSLEAGPPKFPVIALTDEGLSTLRLTGSGDSQQAELEPLLRERPILAGTGTFIPDLGLGADLDGDDQRDLLLPARDGLVVYLASDEGLPRATARLPWPVEDRRRASSLARTFPLPEIRDVDGDRLPDLLLPHPRREWQHPDVRLNLGRGTFSAAMTPLGTDDDEAEEEPARQSEGNGGDDEATEAEASEAEVSEAEASIVYFGDVDGDGVAEVVTQQHLSEGDGGMRKEMKEAKRPPFRYRFYRTGEGLAPRPDPYLEFEATGYAFDGDSEIRVPGGFQDLDGDGRRDLITLTLDFSIMQAVRILTTRRISIGLDFHIWCQNDEGRFRPVRGLDLSGKFRLDLDNFRVGQLSQFAGDFDADGKADFVQMGRGRDVSIHRGRAGCAYPAEPDLRLRLAEEPKDLKLVQVRDLDADGYTDLIIIQPQKVTEPGVSPAVRLDLYLSGGAA